MWITRPVDMLIGNHETMHRLYLAIVDLCITLCIIHLEAMSISVFSAYRCDACK